MILSLKEIREQDRPRVGGKGMALAAMADSGLNVPPAVCVTVDAYHAYMDTARLRARILMELHRKAFQDMRWEEIWDTALRIRNLFMTTPVPPRLLAELKRPIAEAFADRSVAVRSSAPGEDNTGTSFAGLHESYVNLSGAERILDHIRLVWASLWSDRALLYRRELGLDIETSAMAVVVQEMISGDRSGVVFGRSPLDPAQAVIEAVYGLNQGLVDGTVAPDRWILDRETGRVLSHVPTVRDKALRPVSGGVRLEALSADETARPPLTDSDIRKVYGLARQCGSLFREPQDVEWTFRTDSIFVLQARPITTGGEAGETDERRWYLSLTRSFENLKALRVKIETDLLPSMSAEADALEARELSGLSDGELIQEIEFRRSRYEHWKAAYWRDCIPFAHGIRLFGQMYNDAVRPADPFEFMDLLSGGGMLSVQRNQMLDDLADRIRQDPGLADQLRQSEPEAWPPGFKAPWNEFVSRFGGFDWGGAALNHDPSALLGILVQMAASPRATRTHRDMGQLEETFLAAFSGPDRSMGGEVLDLARASYRLRDDDNIYLGRIESQVVAVDREQRRRGLDSTDRTDKGLDTASEAAEPQQPARPAAGENVRARQIVGQPAGPGIAVGPARVVAGSSDLFGFQAGEILVCDAVDPNMTFVAPLAAGIVERRGGMLIHGAIIAREYGIPCVTGVPDAVNYIHTGDLVTVDGFLGLVIIGEPGLTPQSAPDRRPEPAQRGRSHGR